MLFAGGGGWIRTSVGVSQQIYSLPPLATRAPLRRAGSITRANASCLQKESVAPRQRPGAVALSDHQSLAVTPAAAERLPEGHELRAAVVRRMADAAAAHARPRQRRRRRRSAGMCPQSRKTLGAWSSATASITASVSACQPAVGVAGRPIRLRPSGWCSAAARPASPRNSGPSARQFSSRAGHRPAPEGCGAARRDLHAVGPENASPSACRDRVGILTE
jgi:hypothetical protein